MTFFEEINLKSLTPTFSIPQGSKSLPQSNTVQNFTAPVVYSVTAEDGSKSFYSVIVESFSSSNKMLSFVFKANDNSDLMEDVEAVRACLN